MSSTSIFHNDIYRTYIYSLVPRRRVPVCDLLICSICSVCYAMHIRRSTILNLRASENSSENADRVVGFLLVLKFIPSLSVSLIYSLNMDE